MLLDSIMHSARGNGSFLSWVTIINTSPIHTDLKDCLFYLEFVDLVTGGNVFDRLTEKKPNLNITKLILAETIDIVEKLHNNKIIHGDLSFRNILINNDGHFVFTDFGFSHWRIDNNASNQDWSRLSFICYQVFPDYDKSHKILRNTLKNVTDEDLPGMSFCMCIVCAEKF